jgi:hypothetical protein
MARKKMGAWPWLMLLIGIGGGWWLAQQGLPVLKRAGFSLGARSGNDIRQVDFRNFTYAAQCAEETDLDDGIPVRDGKYVRESADGNFSFGIFSISYGDLTGDGRDEAAIAASCNTGGTGQFSEGMVFAMHEGKPVIIGRVDGGDRAFGGLASLGIEEGQLVVERYATDDDGPACCPKYIDTVHLRWQDGRLQEEGASMRRAAPRE